VIILPEPDATHMLIHPRTRKWAAHGLRIGKAYLLLYEDILLIASIDTLVVLAVCGDAQQQLKAIHTD
jgi:hypothetical protein